MCQQTQHLSYLQGAGRPRGIVWSGQYCPFLRVKYFPCRNFFHWLQLYKSLVLFSPACRSVWAIAHWCEPTTTHLRGFKAVSLRCAQEAAVYFLCMETQDSLKTTYLTKVISIKWRQPGLMLVLLQFYLNWAIKLLTKIHFSSEKEFLKNIPKEFPKVLAFISKKTLCKQNWEKGRGRAWSALSTPFVAAIEIQKPPSSWPGWSRTHWLCHMIFCERSKSALSAKFHSFTEWHTVLMGPFLIKHRSPSCFLGSHSFSPVPADTRSYPSSCCSWHVFSCQSNHHGGEGETLKKVKGEAVVWFASAANVCYLALLQGWGPYLQVEESSSRKP